MRPLKEPDTQPQGRDEQAADWCMRLAEGHLAPEEQRAFDPWIADAANLRAFEEALAVWLGVDAAADRPELIQLRSRALEGYRRANRRRWTQRIPGNRWQRAAALAAVLALALVTTLLLRDPVRLYETGVGERQVAMLADGSRLSLDAASLVEVRLRGDRRDLTLLRGRARFDVAKDPLRPFTVTAGGRMVVATGTSFSVELVARQLRVVLYEGRVEVLDHSGRGAEARPLKIAPQQGGISAQPAPPLALVPGRELIAPDQAAAATVVPADLARAAVWEAGQLSFADEPLASAVERVNRYAKVPVRLADVRAGAIRVSGVFTANDTEAFAEAVAAFTPIRIARQPDAIVIAAPPEK